MPRPADGPLSRPNHYFHDSLGCPIACRGDHNHPKDEGDLNAEEHCEQCRLTDDSRFSGLPAATVKQAKTAKCNRCGAVVVEEPSIAGTLMLQYYVPALHVRQRAILCGACGLAFREFLIPSLASDQTYQAVVAELRSRWT